MFVYFYTYYKLVAISTVTRKNIFSFLMSKNWKMWTDVCVCVRDYLLVLKDSFPEHFCDSQWRR